MPASVSTKLTTIYELQTILDGFCHALIARDFTLPEAEVWIKAGGAFSGNISYRANDEYQQKFHYDYDLQELLETMSNYIHGLPSPQQVLKENFLQSLSDLIAKGKDIGLEINYINPLLETMKHLSENILSAPKD